MNWTYAITTVYERREGLFLNTLASLYKGGFPNPYVFLDGSPPSAASYYERLGLRVTCRQEKVRVAGNWVLSLYELFFRNPDADRYALFQDDLVTYRNLRQYLQMTPFPEKSYLNLYTFPSNQTLAGPNRGWFRARNLNSGPENFQTGRGAVALVFDRPGVLTLLSAGHLVLRAQDQHRGWKKIDGGVVTAMNEAGYSEYCHNPTLVQHTGDISSCGNLPHPKAVSFLGEDYDAMELLGGRTS